MTKRLIWDLHYDLGRMQQCNAMRCSDIVAARRPDSLQMGAEQHHVHNTGSSSQLHDSPITEAVSELQGAPGGPASSSEAGGINQHDCKRTEGMSNSQSVQTCATGSRHEWQSSSVGKLFDKELDNHHEEKLLLAQVATGAHLPLSSLTCHHWFLLSGCDFWLMPQSPPPKAFVEKLTA